MINLSGGFKVYFHKTQDKLKGIKLGVHIHESKQKTSHIIDIAQNLTHQEDGERLAVQEPHN